MQIELSENEIPDHLREFFEMVPEKTYKAKDLLGIPFRVAFALQADGWWLRSDIIWAKGCSGVYQGGSVMPESVRDRPTRAHEYVFLLTKSAWYWYDAGAIAEPTIVGANGSTFTDGKTFEAANALRPVGLGPRADGPTRNRRTVWTVSTEPKPFSHFAMFPQKLIEPMVLAGCPAGGIVCDPFMGSGTTALVARQLGRHFLGCDINAEYVALANERLAVPYTLPMFV